MDEEHRPQSALGKIMLILVCWVTVPIVVLSVFNASECVLILMGIVFIIAVIKFLFG